MDGARNELRNRAGDLGANQVVIVTNNANPVMGNWRRGVEILLIGEAYRCGR